MTFGTFAEQRFFIYPDVNTYDGVIINANMVAHAPEGLAAFLLEKTNQKPYIIDPLTHAFQHDPTHITKINDDGSVETKSSIKTLSNNYGNAIKDIVGKRPLFPRDLTENLNEFVDSCIKFQKTHLSSLMANRDSNKYLLFASDDLTLTPYALVAPYFYMTEFTAKDWLSVLIKSAQRAKEIEPNYKVFSAIVVSRGVILNDDLIKDIVSNFNNINIDGFLLWIDGLEEHNASAAELKGLLSLADGLRKDETRELINLHGSYFSILAGGGQIRNKSFSGVAHGPEFGEFRSVVPVGGGIPIARYYIKSLHNRVKYRDAVKYLLEKNLLESCNIYYRDVCDCTECRRTLNGNPNNFTLFGKSDTKLVKRNSGYVTMEYPTRETKDRCLKHYLEVKKTEYDFARTAPKSEIVQDLNKGIDEYEEIAGLDFVTYLDTWRRVLQ